MPRTRRQLKIEMTIYKAALRFERRWAEPSQSNQGEHNTYFPIYPSATTCFNVFITTGVLSLHYPRECPKRRIDCGNSDRLSFVLSELSEIGGRQTQKRNFIIDELDEEPLQI